MASIFERIASALKSDKPEDVEQDVKQDVEARNVSAEEIGDAIVDAINVIYKDKADEIGQSIADEMRANPDVKAGDIIAEKFKDVASQVDNDANDTTKDSSHTERDERSTGAGDNQDYYTQLKEQYQVDRQKYSPRNTFVAAERLELDIEAYRTGQPGANGQAVSGGDIAMDVIQLLRTNIFDSMFEIAIRQYFDEKYPPKDADPVTKDEQMVNDVSPRPNIDIDRFTDSTGSLHDDGRVSSRDATVDDPNNPSAGHYMGVDMTRDPDARASDISTTVWRSGRDYTDSVVVDGNVESLRIPDIRLVEHNDTRYLVDPFGKVIMHDGDLGSGKEFPDYFPKLDISRYEKTADLIKAAAADKGVSVERYKADTVNVIKEHFVERTVERIEKHGEYIKNELLPELREMSVDYHERVERLDNKIEELKAAGDTGSEKLADLEWAKDKLEFSAMRMDSRIEKLENTLDAYDKAVKVAASKETDVDAKFGVVVAADKDGAGKVTSVDYGMSKEDVRKAADIFLKLDHPDINVNDIEASRADDAIAPDNVDNSFEYGEPEVDEGAADSKEDELEQKVDAGELEMQLEEEYGPEVELDSSEGGPFSEKEWEAFEKEEAKSVGEPHVIVVDDDGLTHVDRLTPPDDDFWSAVDKNSFTPETMPYSDTETADKLHDTIADYFKNFDRDNTTYAPDYTNRMPEFADHIKDANCNRLPANVELPMREYATATDWKELQIERYTEVAKGMISEIGFERDNLNAYIDAHGYREFETDYGIQFVVDNVGLADYDKVMREYNMMSGRIEYLDSLEDACNRIVRTAESDMSLDDKLTAIERSFESSFSPEIVQEVKLEAFEERNLDVEKNQANEVLATGETDVERAEGAIDEESAYGHEHELGTNTVLEKTQITDDDAVIVATADEQENAIEAKKDTDSVLIASMSEEQEHGSDNKSVEGEQEAVIDKDDDSKLSKDDIKEAMDKYLDQGPDGAFSFKEDFLDVYQDRIDPKDLYEAMSEVACEAINVGLSDDIDDKVDKMVSLMDAIEDRVITSFAEQLEYVDTALSSFDSSEMNAIFETGLERRMDEILNQLEGYIDIADSINSNLDPEWRADSEAIKEAVCEKLELANLSDNAIDRICDVVESLDIIFHGFEAALADIGNVFAHANDIEIGANDVEQHRSISDVANDTMNIDFQADDMPLDMTQADFGIQDAIVDFSPDIEIGGPNAEADSYRDFIESGLDAVENPATDVATEEIAELIL